MKPNKNIHKLLGNIGQWLSVFIMGYGIYLLIILGLDIGTIVFSGGCLVETLATKIKYYGDEYIKRNKEMLKIIKEKGKDNTKCGDTTVVDGCLYNHYF